LEEETYRVPKVRERRGLAEEISKFALCFALSEHERAMSPKGGRRTLSGTDAAGIKAAILGERLRAGDEVEGEAVLSGFAAIYNPRAYYPSYFLGEMRAELRKGAEEPDVSAHYLPVSTLPPLPDGSRIAFMFPRAKQAFDRPDLPGNIRDVLTRDYPHIPLVAKAGQQVEGSVRFRARLCRLSREAMAERAGVGERSYENYSARGLSYFLKPLEIVPTAEPHHLRGSLFTEMSFPGIPGWDRVLAILEETVCRTVQEIFEPRTRGERKEIPCYLPHSGHQVVRFRRRLLGLVYDPMVVLFRSPNLIGLYLPCDLLGDLEKTSSLFERFVLRLSEAIEGGLELESSLKVEIAYDNHLPWAKAGGALRGESFLILGAAYPLLERTLEWLRS